MTFKTITGRRGDCTLKVRYNPAYASSVVQYRFAWDEDDDCRWYSSPFQTANIQSGTAFKTVRRWLDDTDE